MTEAPFVARVSGLKIMPLILLAFFGAVVGGLVVFLPQLGRRDLLGMRIVGALFLALSLAGLIGCARRLVQKQPEIVMRRGEFQARQVTASRRSCAISSFL